MSPNIKVSVLHLQTPSSAVHTHIPIEFTFLITEQTNPQTSGKSTRGDSLPDVLADFLMPHKERVPPVNLNVVSQASKAKLLKSKVIPVYGNLLT